MIEREEERERQRAEKLNKQNKKWKRENVFHGLLSLKLSSYPRVQDDLGRTGGRVEGCSECVAEVCLCSGRVYCVVCL